MEQASLFRKRPVRRGWMILMVVGSLLVHSSLVGLGYVFWQPISAPVEVPVSEVKLEDAEDVRELIVPFDAPTPPPDMPTPPPDETPPPDDTPPPTEEPQMDDEPTPTPKPKTEVKVYARTPAPANAKRGPVPQTGVVGGNPNGTKATGTPGGTGKPGGTWKQPHPIYPAAAKPSHAQGTTVVKVTTDAGGNIASVTIVQRAGNAILDHWTETYVKSNWHGPPNATLQTSFTYNLPP